MEGATVIILPDRNIPRAKFLMPVMSKEWRAPSLAQPKDQLGNPVEQTRFRIRAKTHDGVVIWTGWFDDREDFDAFLWAIACGSLSQERSLWNLCTPMWPGLDPGLVYDFATVTFLTSTTATTYSTPTDWNNANNKIEGLGGGGNGFASTSVTSGGGGGGGAYAAATNVTISGNVNYRCGVAGGTTGSGTTPTVNSFFKDGSTMVAAGGGTSTGTGAGAAGLVANSIGNTTFAGGSGGTGATIFSPGAGGGAGGPNGAGVAGGNGTLASSAPPSGGAGNANTNGGGTGGPGGTTTTAGSPGGNGTTFQASPAYGPGGGGGSGGINGSGTAVGQAGGNYGGGSSGTYVSSSGASGKQGLIVVTYTPTMRTGFNMPMLGM